MKETGCQGERMETMYPIKFEKILKTKVWGGRNFESVLKFNLPNNCNCGESWEVASNEMGMSVVNNGQLKGLTLQQLILDYNEEFCGVDIIRKFGNTFPLLVKFLDINDKLSVQVHPDNLYGIRNFGSFGKFESWYVIDASEDAKIILGTNPSISPKDFKKSVESGNFENLFNEIKVCKGDFLDINPGLVHASIQGSILICEIQQNSDLTFRLFDFDREENGVKRELHIKESLEVIKYDLTPIISREAKREKKQLINGYIEELTRNEFYSIDKITISGGVYTDPCHKNFKIFSVLNGRGIIKSNGFSSIIEKGQTFIIPANTEIQLMGSFELLKSYI